MSAEAEALREGLADIREATSHKRAPIDALAAAIYRRANRLTRWHSG